MSKVQTLETPAGPATLKRTGRRTLAISVLPDGGLELTAPADSEVSEIIARVTKRTAWIERQRRSFSEMNALRVPRRFVSGSTHRYLGRQYRLKISKGEEPSVRLRGAYFHVISRSGAAEEIRQLLADWFREKARRTFGQRLAAWNPWCQRHKLPEPQLMLRRMAKRWGSASPSGRIALTPELIHAPSVCIDYVIAHEICHLKHPSHNSEFFRLLSSVMPDWRNRKERLERAEKT